MDAVLNRVTKELKLNVTGSAHDPAVWLINPDLTAVNGVPLEYWKIAGDIVSEMNAAEKAAVDAVLLPQEMAVKHEEFRVATRDFVYSRYAQERQQSLAVIRMEARFDGLVNRATYVGQLLVWMNTQALPYYYTKDAELQALTTRAEVKAFAWDFSGLIALDPMITIWQATQIPD